MATYRAFSRGIAVLSFVVAGSVASAGTIVVPTGPLTIGASVAPLVMLDMTKDQNLYKKAYDDYTDLNADGWAETTYDHKINYYGYFDSYKCYSYASGVFSPVAEPSKNSAGEFVKPADCDGKWHGNFLNWVTMSRMDTVRKLLYGGLRSTDSGTQTILERAYIPTDSHAWAKYYNPYLAKKMDTAASHQSSLDERYLPINKLTPFSPTTEPAAVTSGSTVSFGGSQGAAQAKVFDLAAGETAKFSYGDQVLIENANDASQYMVGVVSCVNAAGIGAFNSLVASANSCSANQIKVVVERSVPNNTNQNDRWKIYDYTQTGLSLCNATPDANTSTSQISTAVPLMRVASGNFSLWAANERWQCLWREDSSSPAENTNKLDAAERTQGNRAALSGVWSSMMGPNKSTTATDSGRVKNGLPDGTNDPDFTVRVETCVPGKLGAEKCAAYPNGNYKPIGLLQYYGENGLLKFGMMTGSYSKNKSGGVLRKNISNIADEIETTTTGIFKTTIPTTGSIIQTLNKMRIWGYYYGDGTYAKDAVKGDTFCKFGMTSFDEGTCLSWGNPMSEVYLESLRYLAGKSATTTFADTSSILDLPKPTWADPLTKANYCAPLNVLVFNSAASSYENDSQMAGASDLGNAVATCDAATWTDAIGTQEGINGKPWFVGNNGAGSTPADLCSTKTVANFSKAFGICPEGAGTEGAYQMPGVAYFAHIKQIRAPGPLEVPSDNTKALKVSTYGIALATNTPKRTVKVGGVPVTFMPQGRLVLPGPPKTYGSGTVVDWKIVCEIPEDAKDEVVAAITKASAGRCSTKGSGAFYWNHEDSEQGGDYDQDMWGRIQYQVDSNAKTIAITTDVVAQSTPSVFGFGYAISGTTKDGPHFHSGINKFISTDEDKNPATVTPAGASHISLNTCNQCEYTDVATTATYTVSASAADTVLKDTLWYAAKFGGFKDSNGNDKPDLTTEWDTVNSDGSTTGCTATKCDGDPDKFFFVTNPLYLEQSLDKAFIAMLSDSSASSVAANSSQLRTGSRVYQATFNSNDWSGNVEAFNLALEDSGTTKVGDVITPAVWDAATKLKAQTSPVDTRTIITYGVDSSPKRGIPFTWAAISGQTNGTTQMDALNSNGKGNADASGSEAGSNRVEYLRGSDADEGQSAIDFRKRPTTILGDVVNSNPTYVGQPEAGWAGTAYKEFRTTYKNRTPLVYAGANDGMLHAFKADDGTEMLGYVPSVFYNNDATRSNLSQLANQTYGHKYYADGSPMVNDVEVTETVAGTPTTTWKTILAGGLNWGGRAYYALDITDPNGSSDASLAFSQANAKNLVMWEFSNLNDGDLGFSHTLPTYPIGLGIADQIAKMRNGKWALIVGNGYNSDSGKAALFIFFLDRAKDGSGYYSNTWTLGTDYIKIVADQQVPSNFSGLSTPAPFSAVGDGIVDWIYAGDLNGKLWKFDVSSANPDNWKVAYNSATTCASTTSTSTCNPLFTAKDSGGTAQPITTAPLIERHPNGGVVVIFGTGKYLEATDPATTQTQSLYGVWDNGTTANQNMLRTDLLQQKVAGATTASSAEYRVTTDYCIVSGSVSGKDIANSNADMSTCNDDWNATSPTAAKKGWYMDLPTAGERIAVNGILVDDSVTFTTAIPSTAACDGGGYSFIMELDALTGRVLPTSPFDVNDDGSFTSGDKVSLTGVGSLYASGKRIKGLGTTARIVGDTSNPLVKYRYISTSTGEIKKEKASSKKKSGRISWRELAN